MIDLGLLHHFLGIAIIRDPSGLFLSQCQYTLDLLSRAGMLDCQTSRTPVDTGSKLSAVGDPFSDPSLYRSLTGALQYLTLTRPEISFVVQQACLYMHDPRILHYNHVKRILRYLKGTLDLGLHINKSSEYRVVAHAVAETVWLRQLLSELHRPIEQATIVYCDNISAVYMSGDPVQHRHTKHIEIGIHFLREKVALGQVRVLHVPSSAQFVDILTKGRATTLFQDIRFSLNVVEPTVDTAGGC